MSRFLLRSPLLKPPNPKTTPRFHSSKTPQPKILNDLDTDPATSADGVHVISGGVRRLDDVIQSIIARRSAPEWLPFLPGYSYWVPPSPCGGKLIEVVGRVSAAPPSRQPDLTNDQKMAFSNNKGWPSSSYFIQDTSPLHPLPMEMEVQVKIYDNPEETDESTSEDDEG